MAGRRGFTLRRTVQRWHIHSPGGSISSLSGGLLQEKHKAMLYCYFWRPLLMDTSPSQGSSAGSAPYICSLVLSPPISTSEDTSKQPSTTPISSPQVQKTALELNSKGKKIHLVCNTYTSILTPVPPEITWLLHIRLHRFPCSKHSHVSKRLHPLDLQCESNWTSCHEVYPLLPMYSIHGHAYLMVETTFYLKATQILLKASPYTACLGYEAQDTSYSYGSVLTIKAAPHQNDILIWMLEINQSNLHEGVRRIISRNTSPQLEAEQHMLADTFLTDPTTSPRTSNTSLSLRFVISAKCWLLQKKCTCCQKNRHLPCSGA